MLIPLTHTHTWSKADNETTPSPDVLPQAHFWLSQEEIKGLRGFGVRRHDKEYISHWFIFQSCLDCVFLTTGSCKLLKVRL